jgi:GT2 family glycosyltransferase
MAKGSLLIFVDDDDLPQANFIRGHVDAHDDPGLAAVCGALLRPGRGLRTREELSSDELANIRLLKDGPREVDFSFECSWGSSSNLSVKAEWFRRVGGFYSDENPGVASGGLHDALFGHRLGKHGGRLRYSPRPAIVMGHAETGGCRDVADSGRRRVLELENALMFWAVIRRSRLQAIRIVFRKMVLRRSMSQTVVNVWCFVEALARWSRKAPPD